MPGHSNFSPNEEADEVAKQAANRSDRVVYPCEKKEVYNKLKEMVMINWQYRVNNEMMNSKIQGIKVNKWVAPKSGNYHRILQLIAGQNKLNSFMNKIG